MFQDTKVASKSLTLCIILQCKEYIYRQALVLYTPLIIYDHHTINTQIKKFGQKIKADHIIYCIHYIYSFNVYDDIHSLFSKKRTSQLVLRS